MTLGPDGAYWGDLPLLAGGVTLTRSVGFEPAVASVLVSREQVTSWALRQAGVGERFAPVGQRAGHAVDLPGIAAALTDAAPRRHEALGALPLRADLVLVTVEGEQRRVVRCADLYLREARVVEAGQDSPAGDVLELVLTDVRRFWGDHGCVVAREWNTTRGKLGDGSPAWVGDGPASVAQIVRDLLRYLPGRPTLARHPALREEAALRRVRCYGASPLEALRAVLSAEGWLFTLTLDGRAACWLPGEGQAGEDGGAGVGNDLAHDLDAGTGAFVGALIEARLSDLDPLDTPDEVVVVGARPVYSVAVELEPVLPRETDDGRGGVKRQWLALDAALPLMRAGAPGRDPDAAQASRLVFPGGTPTTPGVLGPTIQAQVVTSPAFARATRAAIDDTWLLLKAPLYGEDEWPDAWDDVSEDDRRLLRDNLWRWWRIPAHAAWLLPILDRAERDGQGVRRQPTATAGRWTTEVQRIRPGEPGYDDDRTVQEEQLALLQAELARITATIEARAAALRESVQTIWRDFLRVLPLALQRHASEIYQLLGPELKALIPEPPPAPAPAGSGATLPGLVPGTRLGVDEAVRQASVSLFGPLGWLLQDDAAALVASREYREERLAQLGIVLAGTVGGTTALSDYVARHGNLGKHLLGSLLGISDGAALDPDAPETAALEQRRRELAQEISRLGEQVIPGFALRQQLFQAAGAFASGGGVDVALATQIQQLSQAIREAEAQNLRARRTRVVRFAVNHPRAPVPARLADAELGVWELPEPSAWLSDAGVANPSETYLVPVPVRAVFGSWAAGRAPASNPGPEAIPYVGEILRRAALEPELSAHLGAAGDAIPLDPRATRSRAVEDPQPGRGAGGGLAVWTFTRDSRVEGRANLLGPPHRIVAPDRLQPLVELPSTAAPGGRTNDAELLAQARALADAVLDRPRRRAGSLAVVGARPVQLDGVVSAVTWRWAPGEAGTSTEITLDPGGSPEAQAEEPRGDPAEILVGFDPEAQR